MIGKFRKELTELPDDFRLPEGEDAVGFPGLVMFVIGIWDLFVDIGLCVSLLTCGSWTLFCCCFWTLLVTSGTTLYLARASLSAIVADNDESKSWFIRRNALVAGVTIASLSRIDSMAILRLRLCDKMRIEAPMSHRHFHFLRYEGMYHYIVEDVPHICVALAQLMLTPNGGEVCGNEQDWLPAEWATTIAKLSIGTSAFSILYGAISKTWQGVVRKAVQQAALRASPGAEDVLQRLQAAEARVQVAEARAQVAEQRAQASRPASPERERRLPGGSE